MDNYLAAVIRDAAGRKMSVSALSRHAPPPDAKDDNGLEAVIPARDALIRGYVTASDSETEYVDQGYATVKRTLDIKPGDTTGTLGEGADKRDGVLGSARIGAVAGRSLADSDIAAHLATTLAEVLPPDLRPGVNQRVAELVRRFGADRAVRRLVVGETVDATIHDQPVRLRLRLNPTDARPVTLDEGAPVTSSAPEASAGVSDTTTAEVTQSNMSLASSLGTVVSSLAAAPVRVEAIVRSVEETVLQHGTEHSTKSTRSVDDTNARWFSVTAELAAHVLSAGSDPDGTPDTAHSASVADVLCLAYPESAAVTAEPVRVTASRVEAATFAVAEAITGLATMRENARALSTASGLGLPLVGAPGFDGWRACGGGGSAG
ncbi:hypothetical protein [Micromonospora sp. WMMA1363]|uniref:hypothetical protein n=1 Tax=Micromonospora sp. WMMA1363 TaxID=3053985 RepID=UPI00338E024B